MSESIKPNATATFYNTTIPSLTDNANIQQALRMYHYGTPGGDVPDESGNPNRTVKPESIVGHLRNIQSQIDDFDIGSTVSNTEPTSPGDGYLWMKLDSSASVLAGSVAAYQNSAPTTNLVDGMLWVDKDANPLRLYVYDATSAQWKVIG